MRTCCFDSAVGGLYRGRKRPNPRKAGDCPCQSQNVHRGQASRKICCEKRQVSGTGREAASRRGCYQGADDRPSTRFPCATRMRRSAMAPWPSRASSSSTTTPCGWTGPMESRSTQPTTTVRQFATRTGSPLWMRAASPNSAKPQPAMMIMGQDRPLPGWDQGLAGMKVGGKRRIFHSLATGVGWTRDSPATAPTIRRFPPNPT